MKAGCLSEPRADPRVPQGADQGPHEVLKTAALHRGRSREDGLTVSCRTTSRMDCNRHFITAPTIKQWINLWWQIIKSESLSCSDEMLLVGLGSGASSLQMDLMKAAVTTFTAGCPPESHWKLQTWCPDSSHCVAVFNDVTCLDDDELTVPCVMSLNTSDTRRTGLNKCFITTWWATPSFSQLQPGFLWMQDQPSSSSSSSIHTFNKDNYRLNKGGLYSLHSFTIITIITNVSY